MKSFTDNTGRTWTLVVNVATIKRVRALCDVDLNSVIEVEEGKPSTRLLERLSSDPVLLVDMLYAACKPECDQKNVTDEDFGSAMAGDAISQATTALLDEIIGFFPEAKRLAFKKILSASRRFEEAANIRQFCIGRRNGLFVGKDGSGTSMAVLASFAATCRENGVDFEN